MKNTTIIILLIAPFAAMAQGQVLPPVPPLAETNYAPANSVKNEVVKIDNKLFVKTTSINLVPTTSAKVVSRIEQLKAERAKIEAQINEVDKAIRELALLAIDLQQAEKAEAATPAPPATEKKN